MLLIYSMLHMICKYHELPGEDFYFVPAQFFWIPIKKFWRTVTIFRATRMSACSHEKNLRAHRTTRANALPCFIMSGEGSEKIMFWMFFCEKCFQAERCFVFSRKVKIEKKPKKFWNVCDTSRTTNPPLEQTEFFLPAKTQFCFLDFKIFTRKPNKHKKQNVYLTAQQSNVS